MGRPQGTVGRMGHWDRWDSLGSTLPPTVRGGTADGRDARGGAALTTTPEGAVGRSDKLVRLRAGGTLLARLRPSTLWTTADNDVLHHPSDRFHLNADKLVGGWPNKPHLTRRVFERSLHNRERFFPLVERRLCDLHSDALRGSPHLLAELFDLFRVGHLKVFAVVGCANRHPPERPLSR